jgi:replicative DNA helicase
MIVLAARPSVGKTAFSLNIAAHVAIHEKKGVLLFTLEMSKEQFMYRLLCLVGQVDMNRIRDGYLAEAEIPKAQRAAGQLMHASIYMDESVGLTPLEMRSRARRHAAQHPDLGLVIIDYMQLMHTGGRSENRQTEISEISRAIKGLARELHVPVMALSQLSREAEKNDQGLPQLSHLRESGSIEQDADVVLMLSRPPIAEREAKKDVIAVNISKQRNGPTGQVELLFRKNMQRFLSMDDHGVSGGPPPGAGMGPDGPEDGGYYEDDVPLD